jgi:hypothetical protein
MIGGAVMTGLMRPLSGDLFDPPSCAHDRPERDHAEGGRRRAVQFRNVAVTTRLPRRRRRAALALQRRELPSSLACSYRFKPLPVRHWVPSR